MRVHELAKELDMSSKSLLEQLHVFGVDAKNHMSTLTDTQVMEVRKSLTARRPEAEAPAVETPPAPQPEEAPVANRVILPDGPIIVKDFSAALGLKPNQLIAELMSMNVFATINGKLDIKIAQRVAEKHDLELVVEKPAPPPPPPPPPPTPQAPVIAETPAAEAQPPAEEPKTPERAPLESLPAEAGKAKKSKARKELKKTAQASDLSLAEAPPIVTFMGHVDHGKTSLLDRIRHSRVAAGEEGGITQHIGAYTVEYNEKKITFLDTPGHAAFTAMRARGANLTDIVVLVVAADDGIMPQTREAIQHAQAAKVCMIVAINKVDLPTANVDRVKQQLQQMGLAPEDWGGTIGCCPVSAATGEGLDDLLARILLDAEMLELRATPSLPAKGFIVEAQMEPGRGPTASILVRDGTLKVGDAITCDTAWGRVKSLINDHGIIVRTAGPSTPVKCIGLTSVPEAGARVEVHKDDREARSVAEARQAQKRLDSLTPKRMALDAGWMEKAEESKAKVFSIVLKADVKGSLEAIEQALREIKSDKVTINLELTGVGNISENDVLLANASNAIIVGFHVGLENGVQKSAKHSQVEIRLYGIIYELLDQVREAMTGLLDPEFREQVIGHAKVLQVFALGKRNNVAGCACTDGRITSRAHARVKRDGSVVFEGRLASLKRFQNDAAEIRESQECGLRIDNFDDYRVDDIIEFFTVERLTQSL